MSPAATIQLDAFIAELENLSQAATTVFAQVADSEQLESARVEFVGAKNGKFKTVQKKLGSIDGPDKKAAGMKLNEVKKSIEQALNDAASRISGAGKQRVRDPRFDSTLPGPQLRIGRLHPITQTIKELKDIMGRLGFTPAEGPEIEDDWHNFEALNIPESHPARDPLENFYLSVASARPSTLSAMTTCCCEAKPVRFRSESWKQPKPPVRVISLGRVYRPDTADGHTIPCSTKSKA